MKAVYSLWTKPWRRGNYCGFGSRRSFRIAAELSLRLARDQFDETELVTDSPGRDWIRQFALPFDRVRTDLDRICDVDPRLWCYGKLEAYRLQQSPFLHLDFDVFLKLPLQLEDRFPDKALVFQGWEYAPRTTGHYARAVRACRVLGCHSFPDWNNQGRAAVAGIVAGLDTGAVQTWCGSARDWVENPANAPFWRRALEGESFKFCVAMEQYLPVELLGEDRVGVILHTPACATELGFVHYAGDSKRAPEVERRIRDHWMRPRNYTTATEPSPAPATYPAFGDLDP